MLRLVLDAADFAERAALLEFGGRMRRADAERQALGEIIDRRLAELPDGIVGELVVAVRRRHYREVEAALAAAGLHDRRAPAWGVGQIISEGQNRYRPAAAGELGSTAIIVPAAADGAVEDLVAQDLTTRRMHLRLDAAAVVGADEIERAKNYGLPLFICYADR